MSEIDAELYECYGDLINSLEDTLSILEENIKLAKKAKRTNEAETLGIYKKEYVTWLNYLNRKMNEAGERAHGRSGE